jgi:hypothetical protein
MEVPAGLEADAGLREETFHAFTLTNRLILPSRREEAKFVSPGQGAGLADALKTCSLCVKYKRLGSADLEPDEKEGADSFKEHWKDERGQEKKTILRQVQ